MSYRTARIAYLESELDVEPGFEMGGYEPKSLDDARAYTSWLEDAVNELRHGWWREYA